MSLRRCVSGPTFRAIASEHAFHGAGRVVLTERRRKALVRESRSDLWERAAIIESASRGDQLWRAKLDREDAQFCVMRSRQANPLGEAAGVLDDDRAQPIRCPGNTCNCENSLKKTSGLVVAVKLDKHRVRTRAAAAFNFSRPAELAKRNAHEIVEEAVRDWIKRHERGKV